MEKIFGWYLKSIERLIKEIFTSEYILWIILGLTISARYLVFYIQHPTRAIEVIPEFYFDILAGVLISIFPLVYNQIFGQTPLQSIKSKRSPERDQGIVVHGDGNTIHFPSIPEAATLKREEKSPTTAEFLSNLAKKSEEIANKLYARSGVYLIFGVLIAFSGIFYFSLNSISITGQTDITVLLALMAPRFGILFFIEFIAFFFLKQYRSAMDEFRHFDLIKRDRESQLAIFLMATNEFPEKKLSAITDKMNFFQNPGKLSKGETTELLEAAKLNKGELDGLKEVLSKLIHEGSSTIQKAKNDVAAKRPSTYKSSE